MIVESLKNYYKKILFEVSLYDAEGVPVNLDTGNYNPFAGPVYTNPGWWQKQAITTPTQSIIPQRNPFSGGLQWWDQLAVQLGYGQGNLPQWLREALDRMGTNARDPQFLTSFINFLRGIGFTGSNQQLIEIWGIVSGAANNPNALQNQLFSFGNTRYMYFMGRWYTQTGSEGWVQRSSNFILQNVPQNLLDSLNLTADQLNNMPFWDLGGNMGPPWSFGIPFNHFTPEQWDIMFANDPNLANSFSSYLASNFEDVLRAATNPNGWLHQFFPDGLPTLPGGGLDMERIMQAIQSNPEVYRQFIESLLQKMAVMFAGNNPNVEAIAANMSRTFKYILNNARVREAMQNNPLLRRIIKNFLRFFDQTAKPIRQIIDAISMTDYGQPYDPDEVMIASMGGGYGGGGGGYGGGFGESTNYDIKKYLRESLKRRLYHR